MSEINHKKINHIFWKILVIHAVILLLISLFLPAIPSSKFGWMVFNFISKTLSITTQISVSPYPFVCIFASVYALFTSVLLLFAFFWSMKKVEPHREIKQILKSRFSEQLDYWIGFGDLLKSFGVILFGLLMAWFHLYWLNDGATGGRGDLYPIAFDSRLGIFIVQWIFSLWLFGIYSMCILLWLQFNQWVEQED